MTKGKKQQSDDANRGISLRSSTFMSDDAYAQVGSVLVRAEGGPEGVLVDPLTPAPARLTIFQTPLGRLPRSLMTLFGLEESLVDLFLHEAQPRCSRCGVLAHHSESLDYVRWPGHGYIALVVDGIEESLSLEEQCELLEVERAVVDGMLVRKDDISGRTGEPVLALVSVSDREHVSREIELWLSRGGGPVRLMHYPSRNERGVEIQKIFRQWRCLPCGTSYPVVSRQLLDDAPGCQRCRGEGWLLIEDDRYVACDDCDGFGRTSQFARYEVAGTLLKDVSRLTFHDVHEHALRSLSGESHDVAARIAQLCDEGFARYPIGMPVDLLSKGERVLATIASGRLSALSDLQLVVDAGALGVSSPWITSLVERNHPPRVRVVHPGSCGVEQQGPSGVGERVCTLRDIVVGPLSIGNLSFDVGTLSVVQGDPGVGKSLFLDEIARRFSKRKKLSHLGSFGDLKRCHHIRVDSSEGATVMELLGIARALAEQGARTRHARERGLVREDFLPSRSRHRCELCKGVPSLEEERCSACDGSLFDRLVGGVVLNNLSFAELVVSSLARAKDVLWADDELSSVLERVPDEVRASVVLGGSVHGLAPALRRFLSALGGIANVLAKKGGLDGELVLVDLPFGTTTTYQRALIHCINELRSRGATIVCAGVPETLENIFSTVVRLRFVAEPQRDPRTERFLDIRMTRKSEVCIER
jgi:hypothetical protein